MNECDNTSVRQMLKQLEISAKTFPSYCYSEGPGQYSGKDATKCSQILLTLLLQQLLKGISFMLTVLQSTPLI